MMPAETKIPKKLRKAIFNNPKWILHDSELLKHLVIAEKKYDSDKVVDIRDVIVQKTNLDLENLSKSHNSAISAAYENFLGVSNLHRCIINILDQKTLLGLLDALDTDIGKILQASEVKLFIYDNSLPEVEHQNWKPLSKLEMIKLLRSAKLSTKKIVSLRSDKKNILKANDSKSQDAKIFSEALLSLKTYLRKDDQAVLLLGSENEQTFNQNNKTDYLNILAKVISHQLYHFLIKQRSIDE
ncbi:MAG: DUF484 family protein [Paracoccaceae bacterium]|nr:DUF484 family protein [Paracoccaceae bacterium]